MKTVAIVQAHMRSSRLPGKVLMDIAGETMLGRVISRAKRCESVDSVVVATSTLPIDDVIENVCGRLEVPIFRGSDSDVLDRFLNAARAHSADVCVRITSDCPLLDPGVSDHIIRSFKQADPPVDYASNKIPQSYPRGLDTEVFSLEALERTWRDAAEPYQRSHVTIYIYEHPENFKLLSVISDVDRADWRWTVDTPEDLEFVRQIYLRLGQHGNFDWREVVALLDEKPELRAINSVIRQKHAHEG
jgi:spore coat polysaccharide biosynthesis protein SpsF